MAEFSVKSVSLCLCGEGGLKLAHRSVIKQAERQWQKRKLLQFK